MLVRSTTDTLVEENDIVEASSQAASSTEENQDTNPVIADSSQPAVAESSQPAPAKKFQFLTYADLKANIQQLIGKVIEKHGSRENIPTERLADVVKLESSIFDLDSSPYSEEVRAQILTGIVLQTKNTIGENLRTDWSFKGVANWLAGRSADKSAYFNNSLTAIGVTDENPLDEASIQIALNAHKLQDESYKTYVTSAPSREAFSAEFRSQHQAARAALKTGETRETSALGTYALLKAALTENEAVEPSAAPAQEPTPASSSSPSPAPSPIRRPATPAPAELGNASPDSSESSSDDESCSTSYTSSHSTSRSSSQSGSQSGSSSRSSSLSASQTRSQTSSSSDTDSDPENDDVFDSADEDASASHSPRARR